MTEEEPAGGLLHVRVRDGLLRWFAENGLQPGAQIPTEAVTSQLFGVSRSTAREALRLLEQEGAVTVARGRGRFLSPSGAFQVERPIDRFESVTEMLEGLGHVPTSAVLSVGVHPPTATEAQALRLAPDERVIRLVRIRYGDGRPLLYTVDTVPEDCLPGPVRHRDWSGSLTTALALHGHEIEVSTARLRATHLDHEVEVRHELQDLGPWLLVEETCVSRTGRPVLFAQDYHRGSDITFNVQRRR